MYRRKEKSIWKKLIHTFGRVYDNSQLYEWWNEPKYLNGKVNHSKIKWLTSFIPSFPSKSDNERFGSVDQTYYKTNNSFYTILLLYLTDIFCITSSWMALRFKGWFGQNQENLLFCIILNGDCQLTNLYKQTLLSDTINFWWIFLSVS